MVHVSFVTKSENPFTLGDRNPQNGHFTGSGTERMLIRGGLLLQGNGFARSSTAGVGEQL